MTTTLKTQTDRERFYHEAPRGARFLDEMFSSNRNESFVDGLKAFAHEWFREFEDEQHLPASFYALVAEAEQWFGWGLEEVTEFPQDEDDD